MKISLHNCEWCGAFMAHLCPYCMHFTCRDCVVYPAPEQCKHEKYIPPKSGWEITNASNSCTDKDRNRTTLPS